MPTRSLLAKGTATASLQGILHYPLDFLVPSALAPRRCFRRYAGCSTAIRTGDSNGEDGEEDRGEHRQLWAREDRTGQAVGEGSSTGNGASETLWSSSRGAEEGTNVPSDDSNSSSTHPQAVLSESPSGRASHSPRKLAKPQLSRETQKQYTSRPISPTRRAPYRSISHQLLSQPDPLSASLIKDYLRLRPALVSATSLNPLIHHAQRTNNLRVERHARRARETVDERYWRAKESDPTPPDPRQTLPGQTLFPHPWASKAYPPLKSYQPLDVFQSLANLHYRLICASPSSPPPTPDEAVAALRRDCAAEGRGREGVVEALSWVLHFYVIYAEKLFLDMDGFKVLREFGRLCPELRPTKQTLHLLVTRQLWPTMLDLDLAIESIESLDNRPEQDGLIPRRRPPPSSDPNTVTQILDVLSHFSSEYSISPGTETLRQIGIFANTTNDSALARMAFDGWYSAFEEGYSRTLGEGDTVRYAHRGSSWSKWRGLLRSWKKRGWVEQVEVEAGEGTRREGGKYLWSTGATSTNDEPSEGPKPPTAEGERKDEGVDRKMKGGEKRTGDEYEKEAEVDQVASRA